MFKSAHVQTLWGPRLRKLPTVIRALEKAPLNDGDHCWLHWAGPDAKNADAIVIVLHGLSGSSDSQYVVGLQYSLSQQNIPSVAVNFRGAAGRPNDRARAYHSGETADLNDIIEQLHQRYPHTNLLPVGYSLGGSRLLNYLSEGGHRAISAAAAVCVPLDLAACAERLNQGFSRVYRNHLINELLAAYRDKLPHLRNVAPREAEKLSSLYDFSRNDFRDIVTFRDYDRTLICPLFGFADPDDYYRQCSAKPKLINIKTPTLLIQAHDDPFMTPATLPTKAELSDTVTLQVRNGGHVGFVDGLPFKPRYWLEERVPEYFREWF
jgi:predicted alpha/beta-fold hydrolase